MSLHVLDTDILTLYRQGHVVVCRRKSELRHAPARNDFEAVLSSVKTEAPFGRRSFRC